tara:strand:+ start:171 stop:392 length:222 start_codon:yes stop_codon:yes gene_type:complete
MITSSHQLDEHLDQMWSDVTEQPTPDDDLMIQYFYNECRKADQMGLLRYENDVPILDDYYAYWRRVESYATTT